MVKPADTSGNKSTKTKMTNNSSYDDLDELLLNIYGAPTSGKTMAALSISDKWPANAFTRTKSDKLLVLDDILHVGFDRAALIGLKPHSIRVKHRISFTEELADHNRNFDQALTATINKVHDTLESDHKIRAVVHDTISAMDQFSLVWLKKNPGWWTERKSGERNTQSMYGLHLTVHALYQAEMASMPTDVIGIFLFHERVIDEDYRASAATRKKNEMKRLGDAAVLVFPDVTGSGDKYYTRHASLQLALIKTTMRGKVTRMLHPAMVDRHATKNRLEHLFTEPVDPNLKQLMTKIRKECS